LVLSWSFISFTHGLNYFSCMVCLIVGLREESSVVWFRYQILNLMAVGEYISMALRAGDESACYLKPEITDGRYVPR
jgi:hypothetical protein